MISEFFDWCVYVLEVIGYHTGWGYEVANIIIFVIIEPALIILFFVLWIRQRVLIKELMIQSTNTYLAVNKKSKLH